MRKIVGLALTLLVVRPLWADQVIMKSGKIYTGRIMGETHQSLLISDPTPRFLRMADVMTIVRESRPPETRVEPKRYVSLEAGLGVLLFVSRALQSPPAPMLHGGGGFRIHPLVEVDGELDWIPSATGELAISNGRTVRGYGRFWGYNGGFSARFFPLGLRPSEREPYLFSGYQWSRLMPKASGDALKGSLWKWGAGIQGPLGRGLFWDVRVAYSRVRYGDVNFLGDAAELRSSIGNDSLGVQFGLAYHL